MTINTNNDSDLVVYNLENTTTNFQTHPNSPYRQITFKAGCQLTVPLEISTHYLARIFGKHANPGKDETSKINLFFTRVRLTLAILAMSPATIIGGALGGTIRCFTSSSRPSVAYICAEAPYEMPESKIFHLMSANFALMQDYCSPGDNLIPSKFRVGGIIRTIQDLPSSKMPHVIAAQEVLDLKATAALCEGIRQRYPYILHSAGPQTWTKNSGLFIASTYPIIEHEFRPFNDKRYPDALCNRGILYAHLNVKGKSCHLFNTHLTSPKTDEFVKLRKIQLVTVLSWVQAVAQTTEGDIFVTGDFNLEKKEFIALQEIFFKFFKDPFLSEHDIDCKRTDGEPIFLESDTNGSSSLKEPEGTMYKKNNQSHWGSPSWNEREVKGKRIDFVLQYIRENQPKSSNATPAIAEIRRLFRGDTDHLATSALFPTD
jgi:hypothetical protein